MRLITITEQGLKWIGVLVLVLWGCIVAEDTLVKHARRDAVQALTQLRHMREGQKSIPVSHPLRQPGLATKPAIG